MCGVCVCTGVHAQTHTYDEHCLAMAHLIINLYFYLLRTLAKLRPLRLNAIQPNLHTRDFFCADNLRFQLTSLNHSQECDYRTFCLHGEDSYNFWGKPWNRAVEHMDAALLSQPQLFVVLLRINPNLTKF